MKSRHYRIPERAIMVKEKIGVNNVGLSVIIRVWQDFTADNVKRLWFYASKEDWSRSIVKSFTGRNLSQCQEWWDENVNLIQ